MFVVLLMTSLALPLATRPAAADSTPPANPNSGGSGSNGASGLGNGTTPPSIPPSQTTFSYQTQQGPSLSTGTGSGVQTSSSGPVIVLGKSGGGGSGGSRLGNAPSSHYRNLQKFLAQGKLPPANYPVPYIIYTNSSGVEKFTNAFTKQPVMINVDNNASTGQGAKDIRVKTEISVNPLVMTTTVERLGSTFPPDLTISVTFPAFFYTGDSGAAGGNPYWEYGYQTHPSAIPPSITMNFTVDHSVGTTHTFNFAWTSAGIPHLAFEYGIFQVVNQNTTAPINPAFANFVVSSPPSAGLTFTTSETPTASTKCMNWVSVAAFTLSFGYDELRSLLGLDYPMNVTVNQIPQAFSICTTEDRAAHTYAIDYTASADVAFADVQTQIAVSGSPTVSIDLTILDMPSSIHAILGDGSLAVTVGSDVGLVGLNATANLGLANIPSMVNLRMIIADLPSFTATWGQSSTGNFFDLSTVSGCIGRIELDLSFNALVLPAEHTSDPNSHYLFAYSNATAIAIAVRLIGVQQIAFSQNNNVASNTLSFTFCGNEVLYVLVQSGAGSLLTPGSSIDLRVVMTDAPTQISLTWTVPFVVSVTTNQAIASIVADLTYIVSPTEDLSAHGEIDNLPASMTWTIDPSGSIAFTAGSPIGEILLTATDPNGLPGASGAFAGAPIRMLNFVAHSVPSFTASWSSAASPGMSSVSFSSGLVGLGDMDFAVTTSLTQFVTLSASESNRGMFYSDNGPQTGGIMVSSLWAHLKDVTRASVAWGGSSPTVTLGFGTSVAHRLRVAARLGATSTLNPEAPRGVTASLFTSLLPTSMDITVTPASSFSYTGSAAIDNVTADIQIGDSPSLNIDTIHAEIDGIPTATSGTWGTGAFSLTLSATLARIFVTLDNTQGILGTSLQHIELDVHRVPQGVSGTWNLPAKQASLSLVGPYGQGLGEFRLLATSGAQTPTTNYINGLGSPLSCMTDYGTFTAHIDNGYWPSTVTPARLPGLYCRQPVLDTGSKDYGVYRTGNDGTNNFQAYALRVRELAGLNLNLDSAAGSVDVQFSTGSTVDRPLYVIADNFDTDSMAVGEISNLPNGQPTNSFHLEWNQAAGHYKYTLTSTIPTIDLYAGPHDTTSLTNSYTKVVLKNVPESVTLDYTFGNRAGNADFTASSPWEIGILVQSGGTRYVGWLSMQSLHFDYSFALPGEESCSLGGFSIGFCYQIFRFDSHLNAVSKNIDGILGIYTLQSSLVPLADSTAPRSSEYVPEWTFLLKNFVTLSIDILWQIKIGITISGDVPPSITPDFSLFPSITVVADFTVNIDFWWDSGTTLGGTAISIPLPVPLCINTDVDASFGINPTPDYVDSDPIHLWPDTGAAPLSITGPSVSLTGGPSLDNPCNDFHLTISASIDILGLHRTSDHVVPFA